MKYLLLLMMATSLCMVSCSKDDDNDDVVATCTDGIQNQDETDVDCGGVCPACSSATCADGIQNQGETGVDCGGPCPACQTDCVTCASTIQGSSVFTYCRSDFASDADYQAQINSVESGPNNYTCN